MSTEETMTRPQEIYTGDQVDSIKIEGTMTVFQEVRILLKDGSHITMRAKMYVSEHGIVPHIMAERGKWFREPSNKPIQPTG